MRWKILRAPIIALTMVLRPGSVSTIPAEVGGGHRAEDSGACFAKEKVSNRGIRTSNSDTDVGLLKSRSIVDTITGHGHQVAAPLEHGHNLMLRPTLVDGPSFQDHMQIGSHTAKAKHTCIRTSVVYMLVPMPSWRAVSLPMSSWSPVTIFTLMPFSMHLSIVSLVSCRGGSNIGTTANISQLHSLNPNPQCHPQAQMATPKDRNPREANSVILLSTLCSNWDLSRARFSTTYTSNKALQMSLSSITQVAQACESAARVLSKSNPVLLHKCNVVIKCSVLKRTRAGAHPHPPTRALSHKGVLVHIDGNYSIYDPENVARSIVLHNGHRKLVNRVERHELDQRVMVPDDGIVWCTSGPAYRQQPTLFMRLPCSSSKGSALIGPQGMSAADTSRDGHRVHELQQFHPTREAVEIRRGCTYVHTTHPTLTSGHNRKFPFKYERAAFHPIFSTLA
eukprot:jgi/Botrbrau1/2264/Bobra.101_2s0088.1